MTKEEIAAIWNRCEKATAGLWRPFIHKVEVIPPHVTAFLRAFQACESHRNTCEPCIISGTCEDGAELWDRLMDAWALVDEDTIGVAAKGDGTP